MTADHVQMSWQPGRTVPLREIFGPLHRGAGDPTMVLGEHDAWWAVRTPLGISATWWACRYEGGVFTVHLEAIGPGASWFVGRLPMFLGDDDRAEAFEARHGLVAEVLRRQRHADWRVPKTQLVFMSLVPSILEQKVTGKQAFAGYRYLVRRYGEPVRFSPAARAAAGPFLRRVAKLMAPPDVAGWKRVPSWDWLQAGVEPPQSRTVMRACEVSSALEATTSLPVAEAHRRLRGVPGIGVWTAAKVAQTAWGDADAPTFEDYHIARQIGYAVWGRETDDAGMAEILRPYRGQRYRAERLILAARPGRERHGPRMSLPAHLPNRAVRSFS